jgi:hypothetical protein
MKLFLLTALFFLLSACAPVRFSTEAEKRRSDNETRERLGLPKRSEKAELEGSGLEKMNTIPQPTDSL